LFGLGKNWKDHAASVNEYFTDALKLFAFDGDNTAGFAALTAAKVAAFEQRQGMVLYSIDLASDVREINPDASAAILQLVEAINEKDWSITDIATSKLALAKLDEQMVKALNDADAKYFQKRYPEFFSNFFSNMAAQQTDDELTKPTYADQTPEQPNHPKQEEPNKGTDHLVNRMYGNVKVIVSPQRAYFNRNTRVSYQYGQGDLIEAGAVFVRFVDDDESIGIQTSKPSVISKLFLDEGERVTSSEQNICEITELSPYDYRQMRDEIKARKQIKGQQRQAPVARNTLKTDDSSREVEEKLRDLKKLYTKKLITKAVYEKKQSEILSGL
jgi:hypothetical protein